MDNGKKQTEQTAELRRHAEEQLRQRQAGHRQRGADETQRLLHELEVYSIELELQNAELRQVREEMEEVLDRYTDLYDFAPVAYFTLDPAGSIRAANLAGASLLKLERSRVVGRGLVTFVAPEARPAFTGFLGRVFTGGEKEALEMALAPLPDGALPLVVQMEAIAKAGGNECRVAIIDISTRKRAEEELQKRRDQLEALAQQRTLSLENEVAERKRAAQAIKKLNANLEQRVAERTRELQGTIRDLQTFSYSISHDLRAPLRSINSFATELLEDYGEALDEHGKMLATTIVKRAVGMGKLIDDLLRFSKNSMQQLALKPIDMTALANDVIATLSGREVGKVAFRVAELPPAQGDRAMLAQVLENLLSNAVKFSRDAARPTVEVGSLPGEHESVYFVKDNGVGFDMKYVETIFGVFQRLHSSEEFEGTGVGLAIVEQVVTKHGGRVWAESAPGAGATFYFSLPKP